MLYLGKKYLATWFNADGEVEETIWANSLEEAFAWAEILNFTSDFMVEDCED